MVDVTFPTGLSAHTPRAGRKILSDDGAAAGTLFVAGVRGLVTTAKSATATLTVADLGGILEIDTTGGAVDLTLLSQAAGPNDLVDGDTIRARLSAGTNRARLIFSGSDVAWLSAVGDQVLVRWDGSTWKAIAWNLRDLAVEFTASGTLTKPPLVQSVRVEGTGGGGGGGSGRRGATGSVCCGGGPGGHAAFHAQDYLPSEIGATETVTIGAAGTGGAAVSGSDANGANGTAGGDTTLTITGGVTLTIRGGAFGSGGTNAAGGSGHSYSGSLAQFHNSQSASATGAAPTSEAGIANYLIGGAGPGGGVTSANATSAGSGASADLCQKLGTNPGGGTAGGGNGADGAALVNTRPWMFRGQSGAGGGSSIASNAGRGGDATGYGHAGGGGGGCQGFDSGRGGNGGPGFLRVIWRF
jgi:hypothetical protein